MQTSRPRHIFLTGVAGFIGFHVANALLDQGVAVTGVDNLNDYYPVALKRDRLAMLGQREGFRFIELDIADHAALKAAAPADIDGCRNFVGCGLEEWFHSYAASPIKTSVDFVKLHFSLGLPALGYLA